jgi:hypothetical protein
MDEVTNVSYLTASSNPRKLHSAQEIPLTPLPLDNFDAKSQVVVLKGGRFLALGKKPHSARAGRSDLPPHPKINSFVRNNLVLGFVEGKGLLKGKVRSARVLVAS